MSNMGGLEDRVASIRRFSRFYTRRIGVLHEELLGSPLSLAEGRVIWELAQRERATASEIAAELGLDAGYLSRILGGFEQQGLIERRPSEYDGRRVIIALSAAGQALYAAIDARSREAVAAMLGELDAADQVRLVAALEAAERLLAPGRDDGGPAYILRPPEPGDLGWIIHRHGALYAEEYGLDVTFEALVARIAAAFIENFNAARERCWIAECEGAVAGAVLLVKESEEVAKLRLLYVEPRARGLGIGSRLVAECIRFARQQRYRRITLWTNDVLVSARHIYQAAGFRLVREEPHRSFGRDLVGQFWELPLTPSLKRAPKRTALTICDATPSGAGSPSPPATSRKSRSDCSAPARVSRPRWRGKWRISPLPRPASRTTTSTTR
jgi:DNA-binding MarR family transcriptional regulator/N-acetylglutamate synthase-like GNAT family acetyltransferase